LKIKNKQRKGILLAGGSGTRLHPLTSYTSKQILPVFDKPMIYYPLTTLMLSGIKEILIISSPRDLPNFKNLLGDGRRLGLKIDYAEQLTPNGIAEAFLIGETFIGNSRSALILGDNLFYFQGMRDFLQNASQQIKGSTIFGYYVNNPSNYGVVSFSETGAVQEIVEKPKSTKSNYAVTGLYFYDSDVVEIAKSLTPSERGELEITDINKSYLKRGSLDVKIFSRGTAWLDMGNPKHLLDAANFVRIVEERQGLKIGCPEETAYRMAYIDKNQLTEIIKPIENSDYGLYLKMVAESV
tara:strand:+ start:461 stop:1351 length:891 start_codon:yes stop_codon:yes gene_type:complete